LKKRLRKSGAEVFDSFPSYGAAFRRRFGIENEQALDLFLQTVSMKSVGDLTDFVRSHMLEPFPVEERIAQMIEHFDDLTRAHEAVLKAREQIERLTPIVSDCDRYANLQAEIDEASECREALSPYFASHKAELLTERLNVQANELSKFAEKISDHEDRRRSLQKEHGDIKEAIRANGGDRIASITSDIEAKSATHQERLKRAENYNRMAVGLGFPQPISADDFVAQRAVVDSDMRWTQERQGEADNRWSEHKAEWTQLLGGHKSLSSEIASLKSRRSNIPSRMLAIRDDMCEALNIDPDKLPFAGELIEVHAASKEWEGAAERLLHGFALSVLVPEEHYAAVARWVNDTHLSGRLVYYRLFARAGQMRPRRDARALCYKLAIKDNSTFHDWLQREIEDRFDHICCNSLEEFGLEERAITRNGQSKSGGSRHEKDDRTRIDDRTHYVLGWSNESKIAALAKSIKSLEGQIQNVADAVAAAESERKGLQQRVLQLQQLLGFESFRDIDWRSIGLEINRLSEERRQLESTSDVLKTLQKQLDLILDALVKTEKKLKELTQEEATLKERHRQSNTQLEMALGEIANFDEGSRAKCFPVLDAMRAEALGDHRLTVEGCDKSEQLVRTCLQRKIDNDNGRLRTLHARVVAAMEKYASLYPEDTREVDVAIEAAGEYRTMLAALEADRLPSFEARFKDLLNENTINEIANFQSHLKRETRDIADRVDTINKSLIEIDYNPGRFIQLEAQPSPTPTAKSGSLLTRLGRVPRTHSPARQTAPTPSPNSCRLKASLSDSKAERVSRTTTVDGHGKSPTSATGFNSRLPSAADLTAASTSITRARAESRVGRRRSSPIPSLLQASPINSAWSGIVSSRAHFISRLSTRHSVVAPTNPHDMVSSSSARWGCSC